MYVDREPFDSLKRETIAEYVPITEMFVDAYQRPVQQRMVNQILRNGFNPYPLGVITVSLRDDGRYAIVDGNCRVQIARKVGITHLLARVLIDKSYQEEAALFCMLNTFKSPTPLELFRARLEEQELSAVEIRDVVAAYGLSVGNSHDGVGVVSAVNALDRVYAELGPKGFNEVVGMLHSAWGKERRAWSGAMLDGVKQFWIRYHLEADEIRLIDKLSAVRPEDIIREAGEGRVPRGSVGTRIGRVILETYNIGLRSRRLPDWVDHPGKGEYAARRRRDEVAQE